MQTQGSKFTSDVISKVGSYLQQSDVFNCAVKALNQIIGTGSSTTGTTPGSTTGSTAAGTNTATEGKIAFTAILADVISGNLQTSGVMQLSMSAMQKAAQVFGVTLNGSQSTTKDISALQQSITGSGSAIAHLDLGNGVGH